MDTDGRFLFIIFFLLLVSLCWNQARLKCVKLKEQSELKSSRPSERKQKRSLPVPSAQTFKFVWYSV